MKTQTLLSIFLINFLFFFSISGYSQSTFDNARISGINCDVPEDCQETPVCTLSDACFKFDLYAPQDLGNGRSMMKFKVTNFSESTFKRATFELPGMGSATKAAVKPTGTFRNRFNHDVINPYNDSLIAFDAKNAGLFSYGGFEVYYYVVKNADLYSPAGRKVAIHVEAGRNYQKQQVGNVRFDLDNCESSGCTTVTSTDCYKEDCSFGYQYFGSAAGSLPGYIMPGFEITNLDGKNVKSITFSTPGSTPTNSGATERVYTITETAGQVKFANPTPAFDSNTAPDNFEDLFFSVPSATVNAPGGNMVTITIKTDAGTFSQTFDILTRNPDCGNIAPLPVELISFKGQATAEGIALNWITATEKDNDRFEIERSVDGRKFEKIAVVRGAGNSSSTVTYNYLDKTSGSSANYYRLNQVDYNGTSAHSKIIKVGQEQMGTTLGIQLLPNPCQGQDCNIQVRGVDKANKLTVEIHDLTGRKVYSQEVAGDVTTLSLPKITSGAGIYILSAKNGKVTAHQKVIIK
jgi:hypothetical protein